jgi:ubiquinone/menaquinone biosynthesis C-methylase UbiE
MTNETELQNAITAFWSTVASGYERHAGNVPPLGSDEFSAWSRALAVLCPATSVDVLDVATGTGFVALLAAELGHRVTAIDLSAEMLREAERAASQRRLDVRFVHGDAVAPPFAAHAFDVVVSRHVFWTLRDPTAALLAWQRLLKPGGRAIAIDGFWFEPETTEAVDEHDRADVFNTFYSRDVRVRLPGWRYFDTAPIAALFEQSGYRRVSVFTLDEIHRVASTRSSVRPSYAIVGYAP